MPMTGDDHRGRTPQCETCGMKVGDGVSYYEGVYYYAEQTEPNRLRFCSVPCLTRHAYNNTETVELPGGLSD